MSFKHKSSYSITSLFRRLNAVIPSTVGAKIYQDADVEMGSDLSHTYNDSVSVSHFMASPLPCVSEEGAESKTDPDKTTERSDHGIHLRTYLQVMFFLGAIRYDRGSSRDKRSRMVSSMNLICCIVFSLAACFNALLLLKSELFAVLQETKLKNCVNLGFALVRALSRFWFVYLFTRQPSKLTSISDKFSPNDEQKISIRSLALGATSILIAILAVVFGFEPFAEWKFADVLRWNTFILKQTLLLWNPETVRNGTYVLFDEYQSGSNLTIQELLYGPANMLLDAVENIQGELIRDLLIIAPGVLLMSWGALEAEINQQIQENPRKAPLQSLQRTIKLYTELREASEVMNDTFSIIFRIVTIHNLILYARVFLLATKYGLVMNVILAIEGLFKASISFYICLKINNKNETFKKWLRLLTRHAHSEELQDTFGMSMQAMVDDLTDNPIGFGSGYFNINETFVVGFFAAVTSLITFLMESEEKSKLFQLLL